jgi:hypothetical protein
MIRTLGQIKKGEMDGAYGRHRRDACNVLVEKNKGWKQGQMGAQYLNGALIIIIYMYWTYLAQKRDHWRAAANTVTNLWFP